MVAATSSTRWSKEKIEGYNQPRPDEDEWYNEAVTCRESWRVLCGITLNKFSDGEAAELPEVQSLVTLVKDVSVGKK